jgi:hypothetical protein
MDTITMSIKGESVTTCARDLWREGRFAVALDVLSCTVPPQPLELCLEVIYGRKKYADDGEGAWDVVDDDWTPPADYPALADIFAAANLYLENNPRESLGDVKTCPLLEQYGAATVHTKIQPEEPDEYTPLPDEDEDDNPFATGSGYITPDGKYHPCKYGKHSELIRILRPTDKNPEATADSLGWVRVSLSTDLFAPHFGVFHYESAEKLTQAQWNTIYAFCACHLVEPPPFPKGT